MKHKLSIWLTGAAAAVLLIAVVVLSCMLIFGDREEKLSDGVRYYNNKCQSYAVQNINLAKGQIVFIGDSITDLYILDQHYADLPLATYNRGIGGDTTQGVLNRLQVSAFDIAPSVIVLMIGTNDINGNCEKAGIFERYEKIIDEIYKNLPDVTLFCMSVIPQNEVLETYSTVKVENTTKIIFEVNAHIKALAQEKGATYLDVFSLLADENDRLIKEYSDDGLHLNEKGLTVWTNLLKPYLETECNKE
jgi:lysophospholipase L1-like esterase